MQTTIRKPRCETKLRSLKQRVGCLFQGAALGCHFLPRRHFEEERQTAREPCARSWLANRVTHPGHGNGFGISLNSKANHKGFYPSPPPREKARVWEVITQDSLRIRRVGWVGSSSDSKFALLSTFDTSLVTTSGGPCVGKASSKGPDSGQIPEEGSFGLSGELWTHEGLDTRPGDAITTTRGSDTFAFWGCRFLLSTRARVNSSFRSTWKAEGA